MACSPGAQTSPRRSTQLQGGRSLGNICTTYISSFLSLHTCAHVCTTRNTQPHAYIDSLTHACTRTHTHTGTRPHVLRAKPFQLHPTLCDPIDSSPPGSSLQGFPQARTLQWVAMPSSRGSSWPRDRTCVYCVAGRFFTAGPPGKPTYPPHTCRHSGKFTHTHTQRH